jgi:nicotinate-nucleotide adenylyltransferase
MLALATAHEARMLISTIELEAPTRPYTVETLGRLQAQYSNAQLFFVMGMDSFRDVTSWREHERLLSEYSIIVAARPGYHAHDLAEAVSAAHLVPHLQARVIDLRGGWRPHAEDMAETRVFITDYVAVDVSATSIRQLAGAGQSVESMTPPVVAAYIAKYELYKLTE